MTTYDFSNDTAATVSDFVQLPPGDWRCRIADVDETDGGTLFVTLRPAAPEHAGSFRVYFDTTTTPKGVREKIARERRRSLIDAAGVPPKFASFDALKKALVGKGVIACVRLKLSDTPAWSRCEPVAFTKPAPGVVDRPMQDARWEIFLQHRAQALAEKHGSASTSAPSAPAPADPFSDDSVPF